MLATWPSFQELHWHTQLDCHLNFAIVNSQYALPLPWQSTNHKANLWEQWGVDLHQPVFAHGQLYVALSRGTSWHWIKILLESKITKNIVYHDVLLHSKGEHFGQNKQQSIDTNSTQCDITVIHLLKFPKKSQKIIQNSHTTKRWAQSKHMCSTGPTASLSIKILWWVPVGDT